MSRPSPTTRRSAEGSARPGTLHALTPPVLALLVSSPAIAGGVTGSISPLRAVAVVAVSLSAAWVLSAVRIRTGLTAPGRSTRPPLQSPAAGPAQLGRIEPARVSASEAIPGTPPTDPSPMEAR